MIHDPFEAPGCIADRGRGETILLHINSEDRKLRRGELACKIGTYYTQTVRFYGGKFKCNYSQRARSKSLRDNSTLSLLSRDNYTQFFGKKLITTLSRLHSRLLENKYLWLFLSSTLLFYDFTCTIVSVGSKKDTKSCLVVDRLAGRVLSASVDAVSEH